MGRIRESLKPLRTPFRKTVAIGMAGLAAGAAVVGLAGDDLQGVLSDPVDTVAHSPVGDLFGGDDVSSATPAAASDNDADDPVNGLPDNVTVNQTKYEHLGC